MEKKHCPVCQSELLEPALGGICPACALREAQQVVVSIDVPDLEDLRQSLPEFEIEECIGRGGMGIVYRAREKRNDRIVALKILDPVLSEEPDFAERFNREARTLETMSHPNIVEVYSFGEGGGFYWMSMEFIDGVNLRQAMSGGEFTSQQALEIIPRLCSALQYAHEKGVYHRDVKPENVLLDGEGNVKMADFGISRMTGEKSDLTLTRTGATLGTMAYLAPEQIETPGDVDHRADIYSLGVVFYEMLTGSLPLGRFPAPSAKAGSDPVLDEVVFRALEKEREKRFQQAGDFSSGVRGAASSKAPERQNAPLVPEVFAGITLFGFALMIGGILASSDFLAATALALWMAGTGMCIYLLKSGVELRKAQRRFLKWISMIIPAVLIGVVVLGAIVSIIFYSLRSSSLKETHEQEVVKEMEKVKALVDLETEKHELFLSGLLNTTSSKMIEIAKEGDLEAFKSYLTPERLEVYEENPAESRRFMREWAQVRSRQIVNQKCYVDGKALHTVRKDGKDRSIHWIFFQGDWRVSDDSELFYEPRSEPALIQVLRLVEAAARDNDAEGVFSHLSEEVREFIGDGNEPGMDKLMEELREFDFTRLAFVSIDENEAVLLQPKRKRNQRFHMRFEEESWRVAPHSSLGIERELPALQVKDMEHAE